MKPQISTRFVNLQAPGNNRATLVCELSYSDAIVLSRAASRSGNSEAAAAWSEIANRLSVRVAATVLQRADIDFLPLDCDLLTPEIEVTWSDE